MSDPIEKARVGTPIRVDLGPLRAARFRTSLFQGCAEAVDKAGRQYVFQLQAVRVEDGQRVGPNDVEDLRVHRFIRRYGESVTPWSLDYLDTMTIDRGGHVQSAHVRISAAGNPYLWAGLEDYDTAGRQIGKSLYRIRYQPAKTVNRRSKGSERILTGVGTVDAVGCRPWSIVLRRPGATRDVYEWHQEKALYARRGAYGGQRPKPARTLVMLHGQDEPYQSSLAQGTWQFPKQAYRLDGLDHARLRISRSGQTAGAVELMPQIRDALDLPAGVSCEPEGLLTLGGVVHVVVQCDEVADRFLALLPVRW